MQVMLAGKAPSLELLKYPVMASPKLDGIRAYIHKGKVYSRTNKLIPNLGVQALFGDEKLERLDGELVAGPPNHPEVFQRTTSAVMSRVQKNKVDTIAQRITFQVFDRLDGINTPFQERLDIASAVVRKWAGTAHGHSALSVVGHVIVKDAEQLTHYEEKCLALGYEGVMVRDPFGGYKMGRSTTNEGLLLKVKRFLDDEATIIGFVEQMHNDNPRDDAGKRTSHKDGKLPMGVLGAFKVRRKDGVEFEVGTGFSLKQRGEFWAGREQLLGQLVRFRYFPTGTKERPRFPVFAGFRDRRDA